MASPGIFDSFNARNLSPQEVARTFVPPAHFEILAKQAHARVVGPRGSGKTTLLKMLHPAALASWDHPRAQEFRERIGFTGVFVAADRNWSRQVEALARECPDEASGKALEKAAFTTQILHALIESMLYRTRWSDGDVLYRRVDLCCDSEQYLVREIAAAWKLQHVIPSLEAVRHALSTRLSDIDVLASRLESGGSGILSLPDCAFVHLDFVRASALAIEVFNDKVREQGARWCLLFDELELAPDWIRRKLEESIRSVDERLLFKLSLSPYAEAASAFPDSSDAPAQRHDFDEIRLWYSHKEDGYPFCRDLLARMLAERGLPSISADDLFGQSVFSTESSEWAPFGTAYRRGSPLARKFVSLAAKDESFAAYLRKRDIDAGNLQRLDSDRRAAEVRKITSIVALRDYFRAGPGDSSHSRRSRKIPAIYAGAKSLFAMVEGNPRWFIGVIGRLVRCTRDGAIVLPTPERQVREIGEAASVFRAMLKTIPGPPVRGSRRGLLALLDPIGKFFSQAAIDWEFDPEPPSSFSVDARTDDDALSALGNALNSGAIVYVPDSQDPGVLRSIRGKRFRLSYMLAAHYHFPLLLGRAVSLESILSKSTEAQSQERQQTIFGVQDGEG